MKGTRLLPRLIEGPLAKALRSAPVTVVTGARQTGKSTLVQMLGETPARSYVTLDDVEAQERARTEPDALVRGAKRLTLDEVQRSPELLLAIKRAVDDERVAGRFLLTGSANLLLMRRVSESLAGRAAYLALWPLTRREQLGLGQAGAWDRLFEARDADWLDLLGSETAPEADWTELARRGGYPSCRASASGRIPKDGHEAQGDPRTQR